MFELRVIDVVHQKITPVMNWAGCKNRAKINSDSNRFRTHHGVMLHLNWVKWKYTKDFLVSTDRRIKYDEICEKFYICIT